ncbi:MAG TPA: PP2C family protein-serine/threonine phosphatase, partial [bacterium]
SVLALMSLLMLGMAAKDLAVYGAHSMAFAESIAQCAVFVACFIAFRYLGLETPVFLAVFFLGHGVLFYSIYMSGNPHPAMMVWLPIIPFILAMYRGLWLVVATSVMTLVLLAAYGAHLMQAVSARLTAMEVSGALGEVAMGLITATALALLFRFIQFRTQTDLRDQAKLVETQTRAMREDLAHAGAFQRGLMPRIRETKFLNISTVFQPHGMVSGDVYAIYYNREGALNIFLGDASGHGVSSAFLTMMVHIGLHQQRADLPPSTILERLNVNLNAHNLSDMFVTGTYVRIEPNGNGVVAHAGHPSIMVRRGNGEILNFEENGVPLGLFGEGIAVYQNETFHLDSGDTVLMYTDGISERTNARAEQFGTDRIAASLRTVPGRDLEADLQSILQDAEIFAKGNLRTDDLSLIGLRFK